MPLPKRPIRKQAVTATPVQLVALAQQREREMLARAQAAEAKLVEIAELAETYQPGGKTKGLPRSPEEGIRWNFSSQLRKILDN